MLLAIGERHLGKLRANDVAVVVGDGEGLVEEGKLAELGAGVAAGALSVGLAGRRVVGWLLGVHGFLIIEYIRFAYPLDLYNDDSNN